MLLATNTCRGCSALFRVAGHVVCVSCRSTVNWTGAVEDKLRERRRRAREERVATRSSDPNYCKKLRSATPQ